MSKFKDRVFRSLRANLNHLLDQVKEFEEQGGFKSFFDAVDSESGPNAEAGYRDSSGKKDIRDYYANLEVPFGSDLDTVKASYHRLMQKYHPDRFAGNPEMQKKATELTQELTRAYRAVKSYLKDGTY